MSYAEWPLAVPYRPERDMWGVKPVRDASETQMEGGNVRLRRKPGDRLATMRWGRDLKPDEAAAFLAFIASIGDGTHRFLMPVCLDGSTYAIRLVQITGGLPEEATPGGGWLAVNLSLFVFPAEMVAPIPTILSFGDAVSGVAVSGAEVEVDFGGLASGTTVASAGAFSVVTPYLAPGLVKLRVRYTNSGNPGPWSVPVEMVSPAPMQAGLASLLRNQAGLVLDFAGARKALSTIPGAEYLGPVTGMAGLTFARASAASYIDAAGQIQFAASGQPRFTHDKESLASRGFLTEPARTSAFVNPLWSGPITPTSWSSFSPEGVSIVPSLFGSNLSARRFTATGNRPRVYQSVTLTAGVTYTVSFMIEQITGPTVANWVSWANLANTTTTYLACPANPTGGPNGAIQAGLFVWQITSTVTQNAAIQIGLGVQNVLAGVTADMSMPQVEAGVFETTLIPGGTRAADNLSMPLPMVPANGFTLAFHARMPRGGNSGDSNILFSILPASGTGNRLDIDTYSGVGTLWFNRPGAGIYRQIAGGIGLGAEFRGTVSWSASRGYRGTVNGGAVVTATDGAPSETLSRITIGSRAGAAVWGSTIKLAALWPHGDFSDAELLGLLS